MHGAKKRLVDVEEAGLEPLAFRGRRAGDYKVLRVPVVGDQREIRHAGAADNPGMVRKRSAMSA